MAEDTSASSETADLKEIKSKIELLVERRFAMGVNSYYLSQLGNDLGPVRQLVEMLSGQKLSDFIQKEFNFEIRTTGQHQNILYIVPPGRAISDFETPKVPKRRYASSVWAAFTRPLLEDQRRFIDIRTLQFGSEESQLGGPGTDVREISREYIRPLDTTGSAIEGVGNRIERWIQEQHLDPVQFLVQTRHIARDTRASLLDQVINALSDEQLRRISLPLDVIRTLSERRAR